MSQNTGLGALQVGAQTWRLTRAHIRQRGWGVCRLAGRPSAYCLHNVGEADARPYVPD